MGTFTPRQARTWRQGSALPAFWGHGECLRDLYVTYAPARTEMLEDGSERIGAITATGGPELSIPLLTSSLAILVSVRQHPQYSNGQLYVLL